MVYIAVLSIELTPKHNLRHDGMETNELILKNVVITGVAALMADHAELSLRTA